MSKPKVVRVGFITENHFPRMGGMEFAAHFLAQSLKKLSDTRVAISCHTMSEIPQNYPYPYPVYRSRSFSILTPFLNRKNIEAMIRQENINILHGLMLHGGATQAIEMGKKFNLPVVVQSHGSDVQTVPEIGYGACLNPKVASTVRYVLKNADKILAISQNNKEMIRERGGTAHKINIVPNGILHEEMSTIPFKDMRSFYGLKPDDFVLITVGRNRPIKRMELLFKSMRFIKEDYPSLSKFPNLNHILPPRLMDYKNLKNILEIIKNIV